MFHLTKIYNKPKSVSLVIIIILILSIFITSKIKFGYLPETNTNSILIKIEHKGSFEYEIERTITNPIENVISQITGVKNIYSVSEQDKTRINIYFAPEINLNTAYLKVREAVDSVYTYLPESVQRPSIIKSDINSRPIFIAAFENNNQISEDNLRIILENIEGTGEIDIAGSTKKEIIISYFIDKISSLKLHLADIINNIRNNNLIGSFGLIYSNPQIIDSRLKTLEELKNLSMGNNIILKNIANVTSSDAELDSISKLNGKKKIIVYIRKAGDANTIKVCKSLREITQNNLKGLIIFDYGSKIEYAIFEIIILIITGIFLVCFLIFLFLKRLSFGLLVSLNIPFSILITCSILCILNIELNLLTFCGIAISAGLVIDSGTIYIEEYCNTNYNLFKTNQNILKPLIFSTITTIIVFIPLIFSNKLLKDQFSSLGITVIVSLLASLFYVLVLSPCYIKLLKNPKTTNKSKIFKSNSFLINIFIMLNNFKYIIFIILFITIIILITLFKNLPFQNYIESTSNIIPVTLEFERGTNISYVLEKASLLENKILALSEVKQVSSKFEKERAEFEIELNTISYKNKVLMELENLSDFLSDVFLYFPENRTGESSFLINISGKDNQTLRNTAEYLASKIRNIKYVNNIIYHFKESIPTIYIYPDLIKCHESEINPYTVTNELYWSLSKPVVSKWNYSRDEADIKLFSIDNYTKSLFDIMSITIKNNNNNNIILSDIVNFSNTKCIGRIYHWNRQRNVSFSVTVNTKNKPSILNNVKKIIAKTCFQQGYRAEIGVSEIENQELFFSALSTLIFSIILILLVLVFQFENIKIPIIILFQIPLSFIVPFLYMIITGKVITITFLISLIIIAGVSVNNSILIFESLKKRSFNLFRLFYIFKRKIKAILIASLTTILGIIPLSFSNTNSQSILSDLSITMSIGITGSVIFLYITLGCISKRFS